MNVKRPRQTTNKGSGRSLTLQTLERGLEVFELLIAKERGPTEIAKLLDVDRATVHRILRSLVKRGFVKKSGPDSRYQANLQYLLNVVDRLATRNSQNWLSFAENCLVELRALTGQASNLCMTGDKEMIYVIRVMGTAGLGVNHPPGTKRPLHCSAVGKAYLGALPPADLDTLLAELDFVKITPETITSAKQLKAYLAESRPKGYFVDNGELDPRVRCIAAPIFDAFGRPIGAIGISGLKESIPESRIPQFGTAVVEKARAISAAIGHRP